MKTDWELIRKALNDVIDACEKLDALGISLEEKCNPAVRWGDYETGVAVGDFLERFQRYPEGAARDIIRLRSRLGLSDQKHRGELSAALINTAVACAETIGLSREEMEKEDGGFEPHCGSAGKSIKSQIEKIGWIHSSWMVPEITNAVTNHRDQAGA